MSLVTVSLGSARNSFHVHRFGSSISPAMVNVHWSSDTRGVGPAERTGESLTTCCPGDTRELETLSRRLPLNPREIKPITRRPRASRGVGRDWLRAMWPPHPGEETGRTQSL